MSPQTPGPAAALEAARAATARHLADLERDLDRIVEATQGANTDDEHDPEGATIAFERAQVLTLVEQARERLAALDAAEQQVRDGTYGVCQGCGEPIPAARLEVRPTATRCVACAAAR